MQRNVNAIKFNNLFCDAEFFGAQTMHLYISILNFLPTPHCCFVVWNYPNVFNLNGALILLFQQLGRGSAQREMLGSRWLRCTAGEALMRWKSTWIFGLIWLKTTQRKVSMRWKFYLILLKTREAPMRWKSIQVFDLIWLKTWGENPVNWTGQ